MSLGVFSSMSSSSSAAVARQETSAPSRRSSFLSRFTSNLGNRNRSISEFYVEPDEPWKTYSPGETVKGSVVLTVVKPFRITHLVVCLRGSAKIYKNPVAPGEGSGESGLLGTRRSRRNDEYTAGGYAPLFDDEVVLCGDGRLKEGIYKFNFELEFPSRSLPSSLDFERGSISYLIMATLTRPTTISPTITCEKRVLLLDSIDVGGLQIPKPRIISLEPVGRKSMLKTKSKNFSLDKMRSLDRPNNSDPTIPASRRLASDNGTIPPTSPVPSEVSSLSLASASSRDYQVVTVQPSSASTNDTISRFSGHQSSPSSILDRTITATTEISRGGALPGETLQVKVSVDHTKPIRSPQGIIVTLYRQGRIDAYPATTSNGPGKGEHGQREEFYPKSKTGLGGLSLNPSKSSSVFRKDLAQSFAPLLVDPRTLTTTVKTSIRIPDDAFPTMRNVPRGIITFRYFIEVAIDLRGKLNAQNFLPRLNMTTAGSTYAPFEQNQKTIGPSEENAVAAWSDNIIDTDRIRREKSVVACQFDILIGSLDSTRVNKKAVADVVGFDETTNEELAGWDGYNYDGYDYSADPAYQQYWNGEGHHDGQWYGDEQGHGYQWHEDQQHLPYDPYAAQYHIDGRPQEAQGQVHNAPHVPQPEPEPAADEKARLRRQEELLLPSQPPGDDENEAGPSNAPGDDTHRPTAPVLTEEDEMYGSVEHTAPLIPSASSVTTIIPNGTSREGADATQLENAGPSRLEPAPTVDFSNTPQSQDDKQELERRRLQEMASAPPTGEDHDDGGPSAGPSQPAFVPSAPAINEEEEYVPEGLGSGSGSRHVETGESLPRYQR